VAYSETLQIRPRGKFDLRTEFPKFGEDQTCARVLRREAARQEAEEAARQAARQPVGILSAEVKEKIAKRITAESEDRPLN
jgi:hypothetical protein